MAVPGTSRGNTSESVTDAAQGEKVPFRRLHFTVYQLASYSVIGVTVFLIIVAGVSWWLFSLGEFSPRDTAFLEAESTLLIAAGAVLVIVFEIERARRPRWRRRTRAKNQ